MLTASHFSTTFDRLGISGNSDGKWGFAAEAQKGVSLTLGKTQDTRNETVKNLEPLQQTKNKEPRLLNTLYDGLSEFYSVRHGFRNRTNSKTNRSERQPSPKVLKETRSTFKNYSSRNSEFSFSPKGTQNDFSHSESKKTYNVSYNNPFSDDMSSLKDNQDSLKSVYDFYPEDDKKSYISPSSLVKSVVFAKQQEYERRNIFKTLNSPSGSTGNYLNFSQFNNSNEKLGSNLNTPTTFQFKTQQLVSDMSSLKEFPLPANQTGKNS